MKFVCLGYLDEEKWAALSEAEQAAFVDECFAYDEVLRQGGHYAGGEALEGPREAVTLRWRSGEVEVSGGPYAETDEQLGGILVIEARDLKHAIQLLAKHPGVRGGPFEIRPAADLEAMVAASRQRRGAKP